MILCEFEQICATGNALMLLETILCDFGQICATGYAFVRPTVGRNSILNFPAKVWTEMCRALLCGDDSSHSQGQSGKRLLLAFRGHPVTLCSHSNANLFYDKTTKLRKTNAFVLLLTHHWSHKYPTTLRLVVQIGHKLHLDLAAM